jgi:hyaluronoglucosaminidase
VKPELGVIEGRFGKQYSWDERLYLMQTVARAGFDFYDYGPKADPFLRHQ